MEHDARGAYIEALENEAAVFPSVPCVRVSYDFSYTIRVAGGGAVRSHTRPTGVPASPALPQAQPSVAWALTGPLGAHLRARLGRRESQGKQAPSGHRSFAVLSSVAGELRPGTTTLVLAAPGHGKSSFLRAVSGQLPPSSLEGFVRYNGVDAAQLQGVHLSLLAAYVDQLDTHLAFLTVRETVSFAFATSTVEPEHLGHPLLVAAASERVDRVLRLLHLEHCADTLLGNGVVRGVSGGERKRVSIAEALVSNARLLCLDEISTGLDASVAFDICASIRAWAHVTKGTVLMSLQQATPEMFALFDEVLLLREGSTVFHGAREALPGYLEGLGFSLPRIGGCDVADYLIELLTSPSGVLRRQPEGVPARAPRSTAALVSAWKAQARQAPAGGEEHGGEPVGITLESPFAQRQYGRPYPRTPLATFRALLGRQARLTARNTFIICTRVVASCVSSTILGLVWLQLDISQAPAKLGMFVFALAQISFANFPEVSFVTDSKHVGFKHVRAGLYPSWAFTAAATALHLPVAAVETACFSVILYLMSGLVRDGGRWAFFFLVALCVDVSVGSLFRLIAYALPTPEAAQSALGPFIALQLVFAGFLVAPSAMGTGSWLIWIYYVSVFAYGARSLAHNEFRSPLYDVFPARNAPLAQLTPGGTRIAEQGSAVSVLFFPPHVCASTPMLGCGPDSYGTLVMRQMDINTQPGWKWGGVGFLVFVALLMNAVAARLVGKKARDASSSRNVGSSYTPEGCDASGDDVVAMVPVDDSSGALPFTPVTLAWRELRYTVDTPSGPKTLLQGVSGVAQPRRLLALMGASGAGKTTLLDVIACRKTAGTIEGHTFLNGFPLQRSSFARLAAYCQQADIHEPLATVAESLHFSAALRLPGSMPAATRRTFVREVMELLELQPLADRLVGEPGEPDGLSPSQRKVLTLASELVSNSPLIFMDEPTSGLDARAALMVMRVVRRVASTGRTVVTTMHQPSAEIFALFDDLLLMQRGGWMAFGGPLGDGGDALVKYMSGVPGSHPCPPGMNPASWMLDVLAGTDSSRVSTTSVAAVACDEHGMEGAQLKERLLRSSQWAASCAPALEAACAPAPGCVALAVNGGFARSFCTQVVLVTGRRGRAYSRSLGFVFQRIKALTMLNLLFAAVWYKAQQAVDCAPGQDADSFVCNNTPSGVQNVLGVVFITSLFNSVVSVSALLPYQLRARAVFYRECASRMYGPGAYAFACALTEAPAMLLTVWLCITPLYFCVGFTNTAASYFFYVLVIWLTSQCFVGLGLWFAALFDNGATASSVISLVLPMAALFGGVYQTKSELPNGAASGHPGVYWLWLYHMDPVSHAVEALSAARFADPKRPSTVAHVIQVPAGTGTVAEDALHYVETRRGSVYAERWNQVGYLVAIAGGVQLLHLWALRAKVRASR